jgi:mRNA-degrading endonuclease RelE of RelBE toxin-antitoxin system
MAFLVVYSPEAVDHLSALSASEQTTIVDQVERQLSQQPTLPTRKRKVLRPNPIAPWVLRLGNFRVFYAVEDGPAHVFIKAIGKKTHNELWIGGERVVI